MVRLHGISISNYYSTVKVALLEKTVPFEEIVIFPSQKPEVLSVSHMGKIPWIELDGKVLTETNVIFDYLEDVSSEPALYPTDPWARAKVKELSRIVELYIDSPARRHIASVYFGEEIDQAGGLVGAHGRGKGKLTIQKGVLDLDAVSGGRRQHRRVAEGRAVGSHGASVVS